MYKHTCKITLANGTKGELAFDMPTSTEADEWEDRLKDGDVDKRVTALAVKSWVIAMQNGGARDCATIEEAQTFAETYRNGEKVARKQKKVVLDGADFTDEQIEILRSQGAIVN